MGTAVPTSIEAASRRSCSGFRPDEREGGFLKIIGLVSTLAAVGRWWGRGTAPGLRLVLPFLSLLPLLSGSASAQAADRLPRLAFPWQADVTLLSPLAGDEWRPDVRMSIQQRVSLRTSLTGAGLFLTDSLYNGIGAAAGVTYAHAFGPLLLEPFLEAGGAWVDGRTDDGSYQVWAGGETRRIQRYRVVTGVAALYGGGLSLSGVVANRVVARVSVGLWRGGMAEVDVGGLRIGVGLGATRPDERWYEHRTDVTPPVFALEGAAVVDGSSIELAAGRLRVLAGDHSGVAAVMVAGVPVHLEPIGPAEARRRGLSGQAVIAEAELSPGPAGMVVPVVVVDSGGQSATRRVHVVSPLDEDPPSLEVLGPEAGRAGWPEVRVLAADPSGIVDGRIGTCPVRPVRRGPRVGQTGGVSVIRALVIDSDSVAVVVRDQAGNEAQTMAPVPPLPDDPGGPAPMLDRRGVQVVEGPGDRRSARVRGTVSDPRGLEVAGVWVAGMPAALQDRGTEVRFDGWIPLHDGVAELPVEILMADGRRVTERLPVPDPVPREASRLHAVVVTADTVAPRSFGALEGLIPTKRVEIRTAQDPPVREVEEAMVAAGGRMQPGDVVLVFVEGVLLGPQMREREEVADAPTRGDPVVALGNGAIDLRELGQLIGTLPGALTLASTVFHGTRGWGAVPQPTPATLPPPGCATSDLERRAGVADLRGASLERIVAALAGGADLDGDGRVLAGELMEHLTGPAPSGLLPFDPYAVLADPEVRP